MLSNREAPLRSASGETLALARLSGGASAAAAKPKSGPKVALRRPSSVKGKLTAWACPAAVEAGATPPPCSKKVKLDKKATLKPPRDHERQGPRGRRSLSLAAWWAEQLLIEGDGERGAAIVRRPPADLAETNTGWGGVRNKRSLRGDGCSSPPLFGARS